MKTVTLEMDMPLLWPPLAEIRRALGAPAPDDVPSAEAASAQGPRLAPVVPPMPQVLQELADARQLLASWPASDPWNGGDIVALASASGVVHGVLLDQQQGASGAGQPPLWRGWMTAPETDWAGPYDVLLEPGDAPFDPVAGVVQAWNRVQVREAAAPRLGRLSAARLAAVRAVQDECAGRAADTADDAIAPRPGFIGLRNAGGFPVLTGTPLGHADPRADYQALYRDAAEQLSQAGAAAAAVAAPAATPQRSRWAEMKSWFSAHGIPLRPALAAASALLLVLVLAPALMPSAPVVSPPGDEIRFRSAPQPAEAELGVRWREDADADAVAALLHRIGGQVAAGPDAAGLWRIRVPDAAAAQRALLASPEVAEVVAE